MGVWRIVALLGTVHACVALAIAVVSNPEGVGGALAYAVLYAGPAVLIALGLRSSRRGLQLAAGWAGLLVATGYVAVVLGNWSGYNGSQEALAVGVNLPTVAVYVAAFWVAVQHRRGSYRQAR